MGDRAIVVFYEKHRDNEYRFSPGVYLHWGGSEVHSLLQEALPRMRRGDASYSAARFCGVCHENIDGNLSLGLLPAPSSWEEATSESYSHGDAGVFLVDVQTWVVRCFNGYGFEPLGAADAVGALQLDRDKVPS